MLKFEIKPHGPLTIVYMQGDIDLDGVLALKEKIQDLRKSGAMTVLLNFAEVSKVNSSVLQHLLTPIRTLIMVSGTVAICNMSSSVQKFLQTAMFYSIVRVFTNEEEAIRELTQPSKKDNK